jgi:hypothetical protein
MEREKKKKMKIKRMQDDARIKELEEFFKSMSKQKVS